MREIKAFHCNYCTKVLQRKHAMINHESFCQSIPKNKKICFDCIFCEKKEVFYTSPYEDDFGFGERKADGYFCTKKQKGIYTLNAERMLVKRYPETFKDQIPMVANCDMFVNKPFDLFDISNDF